MHHPDALYQAVEARQQRYRHEVYQDRLASRPLRRILGRRLIQVGTALGGSQPTRTNT